MTDIVEEIRALRRLSAEGLAKRYEELFGKPPRTRARERLWRECARRLQENREVAPTTREVRPRRPGEPSVGVTLTRLWRGERIHVHVREGGYDAGDRVCAFPLNIKAQRAFHFPEKSGFF